VLVSPPVYHFEVVRRNWVIETHRLAIDWPANLTPSGRLISFTVAPKWLVPCCVASQQTLPYLQANTHMPLQYVFSANNNYRL